MNEVSLKTKWGMIFWLSMAAYCVAFACLYINTGYVVSNLGKEFTTGTYKELGDTACKQMKGCEKITYFPSLIVDKEKNQFIVQAMIQTKNKDKADLVLLNNLADAKRNELPSYLNKRFGGFNLYQINGTYPKPMKDKRTESFKWISTELLDQSGSFVTSIINMLN